MTQDMKKMIEGFKAAAERVRSGESESEEVELSSGKVRLTADDSAPTGIKIEPLDMAGEGAGKAQLDPEKMAAMEKIKDASLRLRSGESDSEEIVLPDGETVQLSREDDVPGAFTMRSSKGGPAMRSVPFEPSAARPQHYPENLPFLPECAVALMEMGEGMARTLTWFNPSDPEGRLGELSAQLTFAGWEAGEGSSGSTLHGTTRWIGFKKAERELVLTARQFGEHAHISLMEKPGKGKE